MHPSIQCVTALPASAAGLTITYRPVTALRPHPSNPRIHSKKQVRQIARSIEQFGFLIPILIDANQRIICGHGRAQAAELIAMTEVPTLMVENLSEAQIKAFLIADNKLTENAEWDMTLLAQNLQELSSLDLDFSLELTGFDMGEIDFIISDSQAAGEGKPDPADEISDGSGLSTQS